jgi:tetratricopeptide (TPR) repeat protein
MSPCKSLCLVLAVLVLAPLSAQADNLRNIKPGQEVPAYSLRTIDNKTVESEKLKGKVVVLVYLSAEQKSSESAALSAHTILQERRHKDVELILVTADVAKTDYFRAWRDRVGVHEPLALDLKRDLYGQLGLIVLPTTIVVDAEGRLGHVISSYKTNYEHVLDSYILHSLGKLKDAELEERLHSEVFERGRPQDRIARHRAAAELLRTNGLAGDAEKELKTALEIDATHVGARLDLAFLYVSSERLDEAEELVEAVLREQPAHRRGKLLRGVLLYHQDKLDEAKTLLTEVLLLNPDPIYTHYYLGLIAEKRGDHAKAAEHYREALKRTLRDRAA